MARRVERLSRSGVQQIIHQGKRVGNSHLLLFYCIGLNKRRRFSLAFGKRAGSSVVRNKAKRIVYERLRFYNEFLPEGLGMVLMARRDLSALNAWKIRELLEGLLKQAHLLSAYVSSHPA